MSKLVLVADEAAPSAPATGQAIYTESGRLKRQSSGGTVRYLDAVSGAGVLTLATDTAITGGGTIALGGFTLTVPATGTAALLATAQTFTAAQKFGTGAGTAQVAIKSQAAGTVGLIVDTTASPTAHAAEFKINGTTRTYIDTDGTVNGRAFRTSDTVSLGDDTAATIAPPQSVGLIFVYSKSALSNAIRNQVSAVVAFDTSADFIRILTQASTIVEGTGSSSALTGTTGTDGKFTVGAYSGNIYLENRIGVSIAVAYVLFI